MWTKKSTRNRAIVYLLLFIVLLSGYFLLRNLAYQTSAEHHTILESIATLLAITAGAIAMVRFSVKKSNFVLFISTGFLGAGLLDAYHLIITSPFLAAYFPSSVSALTSWSWSLSRAFLAVSIFISWYVCWREDGLVEAGRTRGHTIYLGIIILTLSSFLLFAFVTLPQGYYTELWLDWPAELITGFFFLLALLGYLRKGQWQESHFEHWLVLSLIVNVAVQIPFMSTSERLFDLMFDLAHALKIISYMLVLVGLFVDGFHLFKHAEETAQRLLYTNEMLREEINARQRAEETAAKEHHLLQALTDNVPDYIYVKDLDSRFLLSNPAVAQIMGAKNPDELIGKTDFDFYPEELATHYYADEQKVIRSGQRLINHEEPGINPVGSPEWYSTTKVPLRDQQGQIIGLIGISRNITEWKQVEEALQQAKKEAEEAAQAKHQSEERLRAVVNNAPIIMFALDSEGKFTLAEGKGLEALERKPGEFVGQSIFELSYDDAILDNVRAALAGEPRSLSVPIGDLAFDAHYIPLRDSSGQITGMFGIATDVSESKQVHKKLQAAETKYQMLVEHLPAITYIVDLGDTNRTIYISPQVETLFGFTSSEWLANPNLWRERIHPEDRTRVLAEIQAKDISGEPITMEYRVLDRADQALWVHNQAVYILDDAGQPLYAHGFIFDITEHKQTVEKLRQTTSELQAIFQAFPDLSFRLTLDGVILDYNTNQVWELYQSPDTFLGEKVQNILPSDVGQKLQQALLNVHAANSLVKIEYSLPMPEQEQHYEARLLPLLDDQIIAIIRNITDRKQAETALLAQSQLFQGVAQASSYLLTQNELATAIQQLLPILGKAAGVDRVYIFENHPDPITGSYLVVSQRYEWSQARVENQLDSSELQNVPWREFGLTRWYEILTTGGMIQGLVREFPAAERALLEPQHILSLLIVPIQVDGKFWGFIGFDDCYMERQWSAEEESTLRTMAAGIGGALARQRVEDSLALARDEALAATRAKSEFLANMSHEIRTPLNAVIGLTGLLLNTKLDANQQDLVKTIRCSGSALLTVINDILDLSKIEAGKLYMEACPFELRSCVEEAIGLISPEAIKKSVELAYMIEADLPHAFIGDMTRLRQVLVNLLSNAAKFTDAGEITISIKGQALAGSDYQLHFAVKDTGIGISKDQMGRLFQPFNQVDASSTRRYGGTGLGLAISKKLCDLMGGAIWVESAAGQGSTFHFTVKVCTAERILSDQKSAPQTTFDPEMGRRHPLQILLAEDNTINQKVGLRLLEGLGYRADVAANGLEVLEILKHRTYDVILMDVQMPEMDGLTATQQIRQNWPAAQQPYIVAITANALQGDREECMAAGMDGYVSKPIQVHELIEALKKCRTLADKGESQEMSIAVSVEAANPSILQEFQDSMGDDGPEMVRELITLFLEDTPDLLQALQNALARKNADNLRRASHTLKSSSAYLGLERLSTLCRELEISAHTNSTEHLEHKTLQIMTEYNRVKPILETKQQVLV